MQHRTDLSIRSEATSGAQATQQAGQAQGQQQHRQKHVEVRIDMLDERLGPRRPEPQLRPRADHAPAPQARHWRSSRHRSTSGSESGEVIGQRSGRRFGIPPAAMMHGMLAATLQIDGLPGTIAGPLGMKYAAQFVLEAGRRIDR
jgi:hypothetical protein